MGRKTSRRLMSMDFSLPIISSPVKLKGITKGEKGGGLASPLFDPVKGSGLASPQTDRPTR